MVRKFLSFLSRETTSLNQAALLLGLFSFLSLVLAFLRDRLLASLFGASLELDIYYAAFRIPDFLFVTVASVVSLSVIIPFIVEKEVVGREALRTFIDSIFSFFLLLMLVTAGVAYLVMPSLSHLLFKGLPPEALSQTVFLSRLLLISPIVLGLSNLFGSITQAYHRFAIYALAPLLYNGGIILGTLWWAKSLGILGVTYGVLLGALGHLLIQAPFVFNLGLLPRPSLKWDLALIKRVVRISFPRTLTLSMSSLALIFLVALASLMTEGSISVLSFSINLQGVPLALIGVSYSLAAFPTLTRKFQEKNLESFLEQMRDTARFIIFWSLPLSALLIVLRAQVVRVLLGSGLFDWPATRLTAAALALFVISSVFQSLMLLLMRGFYSAGITRKPFSLSLISTLFLMGATYFLTQAFYASENFRYFVTALMKVEDLPNSVVLMLPLGFTLGTILNTLLLWFFFEREFRGFSRGVMRSCFEGLGAAFIMGAVSYAGLNLFDNLFNLETLVGIFLQGFLAGLLGIAAGLLVLYLLRSKELTQIGTALKGQFWKAEVIATDPEIV